MQTMKVDYENDFYTWLIYNAQLLREGRLSEIDTVNIAEELEALGRSEKRELKNRLAVLLAHLLKWQFQPEKRSKSWQRTLKEQRKQVFEVLKDSPGLRSSLAEFLSNAYDSAIRKAAEETGFDEDAFPQTCPFAFEQIMNDAFYPEK